MSPDIIHSLQQILVILIPLIGASVPGLLQSDKLTPVANSMIAGLVVLVAGVVSAVVAQQLTGNFYADFGVIVAVMGTLMAGPLRGLASYLQSNYGFGVIKVDPQIATPRLTTTRMTNAYNPGPTPIQLGVPTQQPVQPPDNTQDMGG